MIFVTVGTHEQQFNRLIRVVDELVGKGTLTDEVIMQVEYSTYEPRHCKWVKFVSISEMKTHMQQADVIITHGGPSSFVEAMSAGRIPIVVPRSVEFGEHVNDHQLDFVRTVSDRNGGIIPVFDLANLMEAIDQARDATSAGTFVSHNSEFCKKLAGLIEGL